LSWFKLLHRPDVTWPVERLPRQSPVALLTIVGSDKIGLSDLSNQTIRFAQV
jgi:hypothetical protein